MSKPDLRVVKNRRKKQTAKPKMVLPQLTAAEKDEAERFKQLTARRAARRAIVHRLIARLQEQEPDSLSEAA